MNTLFSEVLWTMANLDFLRDELRKLLREAQPISEQAKRQAVQETAKATHSELLLKYWLKENFATTNLDDIEGFALDRAMRYMNTVAQMLDHEEPQEKTGSARG